MRTLRIFGLLILMLGGVSISNKTQAQPGFSITFQTFYDELAPYGRWTRNPQYGSVWIPDVPRGFQPYSTSGYWEVTEYGNTWVSEYDWGWAPFHYGRWSYDDYVGWFWIPDYEWGPAWVNWRSGGGYYGWAPLGPGVNINVSINIPSFWWVFVPQRYITNPRWHNYCAPRGRVSHYYNNTVIINNYYRSNNRTYVYGPRRDEIQRVTRRDVPVRTIDMSPRGRGRVIVAESGRGNDRYGAGEYGGTRRNSPTREGSTVDMNTGRDRSNRNYDNRIEDRPDNARREYPSSNRSREAQRNVPEERGNDRFGRNRESAPVTAPSERSGRYEAPSQPERNRDFGNGSERNNRAERSAEPSGRGRGSYEAPAPRVERQERSAPSEPRGNDRGSRSSGDNGGGRGASERSSRGPR